MAFPFGFLPPIPKERGLPPTKRGVQADRSVVLSAVEADGCALQFAAPKLQDAGGSDGFRAAHTRGEQSVLGVLVALG